MAYAREIGLRYMRSKHKAGPVSVITFIAATGVALGVAALLAVLSITSGFQEQFRAKVLGVNAHVLVMKYGVDFSEYRDVIELAESQPETAGVGPFLIQDAMLARGGRVGAILVKGIDPERMPTVLDLPNQIIDGSLEGLRQPGAHPPVEEEDELGPEFDWARDLRDPDAEPEEPEAEPEVPPAPSTLPEVEIFDPSEVEQLLGELEEEDDWDLPDDDWEEELLEESQTTVDEEREQTLPGIVLGRTLAQRFDLEVGDLVRLVSPLAGVDTASLGHATRAPRSREYRVIAIFQAGFQEYDSNLVYVDLYEAQYFHGRGDVVTGVELRVHELDTSLPLARTLEHELGGPFHTLDWSELNRNLFTMLKIQKVALSFVIATIIFVAAFMVVATLIMVVLEKKREIAILKAMGASDGTVLRIFAIQGVIVGSIGTVVGLALGALVVLVLSQYQIPLDPKVYLIDHVPVSAGVLEFIITAIVSLAICSLSTLAPSLWAARMLPVDGLRHE